MRRLTSLLGVPVKRPAFVIAAHYFSDGWPLDSLQVMRLAVIRRELAQLARDGFNTIIVVVPWRSFQSSQQPIEYDSFYASQLRLVLREAQRAGLAVLLRVAYTHQVMLEPGMNGFRWAQALLTDPEVETAWLDYFLQIARIADDYPCCIGGFISWEELWHAFRVWQEQTGDANKAAARSSGYLDYLNDRGVAHGNCIPPKDSPAHAEYLAFANARMTALFEKARGQWPKLGVEYRVDKDPVPTESGVEWRDNSRFMDWEPNRYSYWAPFMGARNVGEALSAQEAETLLEHMLTSTSDEGVANGQIVEQFNFVDNTQKYLGTHAHIADHAIDDFLLRATPLLQRYTGGYGLWASRDYRMNLLYNAALLGECRGWTLSDNCQHRASGGVRLGEGGRLTQRIEPRVTWVQRNHPAQALTLEIEFLGWQGWSPIQLRARVNGGLWASCKANDKGRLIAKVPASLKDIFDQGLSLELENRGRAVSVVRVFLFYETYCGGVRDTGGRPQRFLSAIHRFNRQLRKPVPPGQRADVPESENQK